jgi:transglutaminase-like putative cysteine protease
LIRIFTRAAVWFCHPDWELLVAWLRHVLILFLALAGTFSSPASMAQTVPAWPPVGHEELELKDNPLRLGEPAMILYREIQTDSAKSLETHFIRIKIFKEIGKKYADVEIPYLEKELQVQNIQGRTIKPDGQAIDFGGTVYDRIVEKTKRFKINIKSFTFPDVQPGSIIEYSYQLHRHNSVPDVFKRPLDYVIPVSLAYPAAEWTIQRDLFVRRTHFVFRPFTRGMTVEIRSIHLPKMTEPQRGDDGSITIDVENVPAFQAEEHAPPEDFSIGRIELFYIAGFFTNDSYWRDLARFEARGIEKFLGKSKIIYQEAARLVSPNDSPEAKLRKIYNRVQQIRYVSYERSRTEKERKQESLKPNKNAEDVLTRGYAFENEINLLFVALARAAGLEAYLVRITARDHTYFLKSLPDMRQLDAEVVEVRLDSKSIFLDPATRYCPFGLLPWEETDAGGIRLDQDHALVVQTPSPNSWEAVISRKGRFKLDDRQDLQGKLEVSFAGQEALSRRIKANDEDEAGRRKLLENEIESWLPKNATAKLVSASCWTESTTPLTAVFEVQVPDFASRLGERLMFPAFVFQSPWKKAFQSQTRENMVDLHYGHQEIDDLTFETPSGYQWENFPLPRSKKDAFATYELSTEKQGSELRLKCTLNMNGYFFQTKDYPGLHRFFEYLRENDDEQAVLRVASANASSHE